ncbi:MAG TPA: pyridoxal-phosphate dependent enzyme, partial [Chloroflexota bacterium]|nr:pyridoxal-phosphate dependent enzyme [Chloroflexota bacterium]
MLPTPISLGEGHTPLVPSRWIGPHLGLSSLHFKLEQTNPTGSYKDRFAARLITLLVQGGHPFCLATSSGNSGAAVAAYSAAAGLPCLVCVPAEAPAAKLTQIRAYGARLLRVRGLLESPAALRQLLHRLQSLTQRRAMPLGTSAYALSPDAMAGIEPLSAELTAALGAPPDRVFAPVGGGGLLTAIHRGFQTGAPRPTPPPRIHAVQPDTNDTIATALHAGEDRAREITTVTRISGLAVQIDLDATSALQAVRASSGTAHAVDEPLIRQVQSLTQRRAMPLGTSAYSLSPDAMAGIEPLSAELTAALGAPPHRVFAPVGGGGLLTAIPRGVQTG